jgi:hypothetical protein
MHDCSLSWLGTGTSIKSEVLEKQQQKICRDSDIPFLSIIGHEEH